MDWSYTEQICPDRQEMLLAAPEFDSIGDRIIEEMRIIRYDVRRGKLGEVKGCRRPEFMVQVSEEAFDLFFNSPSGYRGQYHKSPADGERANAHLISMMMDRLVEYAQGASPSITMGAEEVRLSLLAGSAKTWINEKGVRVERTDLHLQIDLEIEPWVSTARAYVASPGDFPDQNKEVKAVDGIRAPRGTILEIKGAFIDDNKNERVAAGKVNRSQQIHLYGFT